MQADLVQRSVDHRWRRLVAADRSVLAVVRAVVAPWPRVEQSHHHDSSPPLSRRCAERLKLERELLSPRHSYTAPLGPRRELDAPATANSLRIHTVYNTTTVCKFVNLHTYLYLLIC